MIQMTTKISLLIKIFLLILGMGNHTIAGDFSSKEQSNNGVSNDRVSQTLVTLAYPTIIGLSSATAVAAYYTTSENSIRSIFLNTVSLALPFLSVILSFNMEENAQKSGGYLGRRGTMGIIPTASLIRNILNFGLNIGATTTSWLYRNSCGIYDNYRVANIILTSISSILTIVGTTTTYLFLHPYFDKYKNISRK